MLKSINLSFIRINRCLGPINCLNFNNSKYITTMKKLLILMAPLVIMLSACGPEAEITQDIPNTENSILITGINESISYTYTDNNGRTAESVPEDVNMIQILILNSEDEVVHEQYHYNQNAYNHYYYDSASYGGDDYMFENTLPDTLYIPPLDDGIYTVLASTAYASYYYYDETSNTDYPFIDSYQVSDGPIFVGKASTEVTSDTDQVVVLDMTNISSRVDLNVISENADTWSVEVQLESNNGKNYSFETESFVSTEYDYDYIYLWKDNYWNQPSYYFLPRGLKSIRLYFYDYESGFNISFETDINPDLEMGIGDVFTLNIDIDGLIEGGGSAGFNWDDIDWNDVGDVNIP